MLTREENELLIRTGPGTPMGGLVRRYWIPVLPASELAEPDGPPVRVKLLGERLVAFRDTNGRIGLLGEFCPHRTASLFFGRNEECGLRCVYHGWKFDIEGTCVDQPSEPEGSNFRSKIRQAAYPCVERGGVVLAYMGPATHKPPLPELEWLNLPDDHVYVSKRYQDCHWLQGLEGDVDLSHLGFLHGIEAMSRGSEHDFSGSQGFIAQGTHPRLEVVHTECGLLQGARRDADAEHHYWRIGAWFLPCYSMLPSFAGDAPLGGHAWVPVDDTKVWAFGVSWHPRRPLSAQELAWFREGTPTGIHSTMIPGTATAKRNKGNGYADPDAPGTQPWQRITHFQDQDTAITESIGSAFDRTQERLGSTDIVIANLRRRLAEAARALSAGTEPQTNAKGYRYRGISCLLPRATPSWSDAVAEWMETRPETFRPGI